MTGVDVNILKNDYLGIYSNAFAIKGKEHTMFFDSGLNGNESLVKPLLADNKIMLFSTHGHWDHIGMHSYLKKQGAVILAHEGDKRYLEDFKWHWYDLFGQYENDFDLPEARRTTFNQCIGEPVEIDNSLTDGMVINVEDMSFEILHTPGHSDGSVCIYEDTQKILFTGDSLMGDGFFTGLPQYTDPKRYIASMERLEKLNSAMVYSCHNEPINGSELPKIARRGIERALSIADTIEEYVYSHRNDNEIPLKSIVAHTCDVQQKTVGGGACVTVMAHLVEIADKYPILNTILKTHSRGV